MAYNIYASMNGGQAFYFIIKYFSFMRRSFYISFFSLLMRRIILKFLDECCRKRFITFSLPLPLCKRMYVIIVCVCACVSSCHAARRE